MFQMFNHIVSNTYLYNTIIKNQEKNETALLDCVTEQMKHSHFMIIIITIIVIT